MQSKDGLGAGLQTLNRKIRLVAKIYYDTQYESETVNGETSEFRVCYEWKTLHLNRLIRAVNRQGWLSYCLLTETKLARNCIYQLSRYNYFTAFANKTGNISVNCEAFHTVLHKTVQITYDENY